MQRPHGARFGYAIELSTDIELVSSHLCHGRFKHFHTVIPLPPNDAHYNVGRLISSQPRRLLVVRCPASTVILQGQTIHIMTRCREGLRLLGTAHVA